VGNDIEQAELAEAYSQVPEESVYKEIEKENSEKFQKSIEDLKEIVNPDCAILDIGSGNGLFLKMLRANGFGNVCGHELPGSYLDRTNDGTFKIYIDDDYKTIPSKSFDLITLLDVAEHVRDPVYLFSECGRILKEGGFVYLHTPVVTKTDRIFHVLHKVPLLRKAAAIWQRGRTSVYHLRNYTAGSLTLLLTGAGFEDISIRVENELSYPLRKYVGNYFCGNIGLPKSMAPFFTPLFYPFLCTDFLNSNKAIAAGRKKGSQEKERLA